jgi:hypothetical protein
MWSRCQLFTSSLLVFPIPCLMTLFHAMRVNIYIRALFVAKQYIEVGVNFQETLNASGHLDWLGATPTLTDGCVQCNALILSYKLSTIKCCDFRNVLKIEQRFFQVLSVWLLLHLKFPSIFLGYFRGYS